MFTSVHLSYIHYTLISLSIYRIVLKNKIQVHCYTLMTEGEISSLFSLSRKHKHELYCIYQLKREDKPQIGERKCIQKTHLLKDCYPEIYKELLKANNKKMEN